MNSDLHSEDRIVFFIIIMMMPPYYHPTYNSDVSSINDSSSGNEEDVDNNNFVGQNYNPTGIRSRCDFEYIDLVARSNDYEPFMRHGNNNNPNNNTAFRLSKRANVGAHAMKGGLKLIGELHESKNEVFINTLCEASRKGFMNTLCFPNRSKWLQTKVLIWFGSGGILGR